MDRRRDEAVSVCIPVYNGAEYLDEAVRSARHQTHSPVEILVVDDGSTDASIAIAQAHARDDARVRVLRNPVNLGLTQNWWRSVLEARGDWVKFLFQDDLLHPTCIERLVDGALESGAVIGFCNRQVRCDGPNPDPELAKKIEASALAVRTGCGSRFFTGDEVADMVLSTWTMNVFGEPTAALIRRDVFEQFGPFDPAFTQLCDLEYWLRVGVNRGIWYDADELATFRVHGAAASTGNRATRTTWVHYGEPALLTWRVLADPWFEPVRRAAAAAEPPVDLAQKAARQTVRFRAEARRSRQAFGLDVIEDLAQRHGLARIGPVQQVWNRLPAPVRDRLR